MIISYTEFEIFPQGFIEDFSNYTTWLAQDPGKIDTPLQQSYLQPLDTEYFKFDSSEQTITLKHNDVELPNPLFYVVICNSNEEIIMWQMFKIVLTSFIPERINSPPFFEKDISSINVEQCPRNPTTDWEYFLPILIDTEGDTILETEVRYFSEAIIYDKELRKFSQKHFVGTPTNVTVELDVSDDAGGELTYKFDVIFSCSKPKKVYSGYSDFLDAIDRQT